MFAFLDSWESTESIWISYIGSFSFLENVHFSSTISQLCDITGPLCNSLNQPGPHLPDVPDVSPTSVLAKISQNKENKQNKVNKLSIC